MTPARWRGRSRPRRSRRAWPRGRSRSRSCASEAPRWRRRPASTKAVDARHGSRRRVPVATSMRAYKPSSVHRGQLQGARRHGPDRRGSRMPGRWKQRCQHQLVAHIRGHDESDPDHHDADVDQQCMKRSSPRRPCVVLGPDQRTIPGRRTRREGSVHAIEGSKFRAHSSLAPEPDDRS